jgi:hypothetical protein
MNHPIYKVRTVKITAPYTLTVGFDDGTQQTITTVRILVAEYQLVASIILESLGC